MVNSSAVIDPVAVLHSNRIQILVPYLVRTALNPDTALHNEYFDSTVDLPEGMVLQVAMFAVVDAMERMEWDRRQ